MYCSNCGSQIAEGAAFCNHCGNAVSNGAQEGMQGQNGGMQYQSTGMQDQNGSMPYQNAGMQGQNGGMPYRNAGMQGTMQNGNWQNPMGATAYNGQGAVKKINLAAIVSSALLAIAMFLPYVSIVDFVSVSKSLIEGDGIFFMVVAAIGVIGALVKKNGIVILAGVLSCLLCMVEIFMLLQNEFSELYTKGAGYYLMIIASVMLLISGFIKRK